MDDLLTTDVDIDDVLRDVKDVARPAATQGEVADYIEPLKRAKPDSFAIAVVEMDGTEHCIGDVDVPFAIQSISKVFSLVLAMRHAEAAGGVSDELWQRVGREPSGDPFNSLVQLEHERGIPRNPMINAGALVVDDVLLDHCDPKEEALALLSELAGEDITFDDAVLAAEVDTGHRNRAMASFLRSFDNLNNPVDDVLDAYLHQCAIAMSSRQLARSVRFLANDGVDPPSGRRILPSVLARRVAAIMLTCGTYDAAGEFAFQVGLPCKSGIAGGIAALVPDRMGVAVWSPPLDEAGNSLAGRLALHELAERLGLSIF